jgi:hypothetical protein
LNTVIAYFKNCKGKTRQILAGIVAFVLLFLGTFGEIAHSGMHPASNTHATSTSASDEVQITSVTNSDACLLCQWEASLLQAGVAVPLLLMGLLVASSTVYLQRPTPLVRLIVALRSNRGPPASFVLASS